jgi:hypothetical protein
MPPPFTYVPFLVLLVLVVKVIIFPLILSFSHSLILSFSHSLILSFSHSLILNLRRIVVSIVSTVIFLETNPLFFILQLSFHFIHLFS